MNEVYWTAQAGYPLLATLQRLPLAGAVLLMIMREQDLALAFDRLGGLFDRVPFIAVAFLIGGLAILGMPGTPGFDAVHLVLEASIETFGALPTIATALGNVAAAGFLLWAFQRAFLAPRPRDVPVSRIVRTRPMEYFVGGATLLVLLAAGFYPEPWLKLTDSATQALAAYFHHG